MATPADSEARVYTELIQSGEKFTIRSGGNNTSVKRLALAYVSGAPTVKGNVSKLIVTDANGDEQIRTTTHITLTSTNAFIALESSGIYSLDVTVDCTSGSVIMMAYL